MKIKCPICKLEYIDRADLANCLMDHKETPKYLADKIFKIHEKIESLYKPDPPDYKPMFANDGIIKSVVIDVLKSLLESQ